MLGTAWDFIADPGKGLAHTAQPKPSSMAEVRSNLSKRTGESALCIWPELVSEDKIASSVTRLTMTAEMFPRASASMQGVREWPYTLNVATENISMCYKQWTYNLPWYMVGNARPIASPSIMGMSIAAPVGKTLNPLPPPLVCFLAMLHSRDGMHSHFVEKNAVKSFVSK